jgi:hypothetical protein
MRVLIKEVRADTHTKSNTANGCGDVRQKANTG